MPVAQTRRFGPLEYEAASVLQFPWGLPGFPAETRFLLLEQPDIAPIVALQSIASPDLCFLAAPAGAVDPDYALAVSPEDRERLSRQGSPEPQLLTLVLLCAPRDGPMSANLLAPIVINLSTRVGLQAIRADRHYSHQHRIGAAPSC